MAAPTLIHRREYSMTGEETMSIGVVVYSCCVVDCDGDCHLFDYVSAASPVHLPTAQPAHQAHACLIMNLQIDWLLSVACTI
jgi:hypothetical protein